MLLKNAHSPTCPRQRGQICRVELRELTTSWLFHMILEVKHEIAFEGEFEDAAATWNQHHSVVAAAGEAKVNRRKKKSSKKK